MKIIIGADIVPTNSNFSFFAEAAMDKLVDQKIVDVLRSADFRMFNLEVPLTDNENPIQKCGPSLRAPSSSVYGFQALGIDFFTLANNHILDQGESGLYDTMKVLDGAGIAYAGAGNIKDAAKPYIIEKQGTKIGIYCCAEHEFSIATKHRIGANPFDPLNSLDHIQILKNECDFVIVLYHGGREEYRYASPCLQQTCRKIVEKGADLVICQHSHCIGCYEKWYDSTIIYGQGNFLFDGEDNEFWASSLLIQVDAVKRTIEYTPICKNGASVRMASPVEAEEILRCFEERSQEITNPEILEQRFQEQAQRALNAYFGRSLGRIPSLFVFRLLNKAMKGKLRSKCYTDSDRMALINVLECEAHREFFAEGLKHRE